MAVPGNSVANSAVLFREVHKNAWLRRLPTEEKKIGAHSKKGERVWCVFCVHDDVEPFIEIYADQKMAAAHKPDWCASLSHTLHVSPTICARDDEFEFVVTLPDTALRLSAPSWEVMMEWVESIGGKLREMHVLSPRENLYSRQPESRAPLLPTRDPNSPLPPPPASVPPMLVPGVEALTLNTPSQPPPHPDSQNITVIQVDPIDYQPSTAETSSGLISTLINCDDNDVDDDTFNEDEDSLDDDQDVFGEDVASVCPPLPRLPCQLNRTNHSCDRNRNSQNNCNNSSQLIEATSNHRGSNNTQLNNRVIEVEGAPTTSNHRSSNNTQVNNRLIEVEGALTTSNHRSSNNTQLTSQLIGVEGAPLTSNHRSSNNSQLIGIEGAPTVPNHRSGNNSQLIGVEGAPLPSNHRGSTNSQLIGIEGAPTVPNHRGGNNSQLIGVEGAATTSNHRNAQLTSQLIEVEGAATDSPSTSNQSSHRSISRSRTGNDSGHVTRHPAADSDSRVEPPASPVLYEHVFLASSPASPPPPPPAEDATAASSSSSSPPPLSADLRYSQVQDRVVPPVNAIRPRSGLRPNRRRSSDSSVPADRIRRLQAPPHPFRQPVAGAVEAGAGVTLRERQVQQLRREMTHQGGVRLQLRRKDCLGSIALVDAFGAIWVAGWKQKEHPMLYNALHIGDKVISVAGVRVQSSCDAHKLIRGAPSLYVAVVVRRVPFGRALALRRESEGQSVGVVQEGGTAEIKEVVAGGLAAVQGGLPPRAPSVERPGQLTTWCLTEINGRPLNLFFKENEVRDRLNAVGLDISFLVQPTDLVKQIRRQLKALRGYKDYIVQ